jgi:prepilin-type N-terminal cleavage/methylation domain-containing protein
MRYLLRNQATRHGFTVVELLIVIVIIAILAAVSIATYSGIQERARVVKNQAALNQYKKMMTTDEVLNDINIGSFSTTCLGQFNDYPQTDIFPAGSCMVYGSDVPYVMQGPVMASGITYDVIHKDGRPTVDASMVAVEPDWISLRGIVLLTNSNTNGTRSGYMYKQPSSGCFGGDQLMTDAAAGGSGNPIGWWSMSGVCWSEIELNPVL